MARREIVNLVRVVLDELPDTDGTLLREVFLEERDRDEVCKRHGVSRNYLRVLLHRAKQRFRELYEESIARQARSLRGRLATDGPRPRAAD
jgi:RNA polymerase sigma-70 factor (ECF subfamily)